MTRTERSTALARFEAALMQPLPGGPPIDIAYNRAMRNSRHEAWRIAWAKTQYLDAVQRFGNAASLHAMVVEGDDRKACEIARRHVREMVPAWRQAVAEQMLTPAPDVVAVNWKRIAARQKHLPISRTQIEAAIAADEAWLAAHPVSRAGKAARQ